MGGDFRLYGVVSTIYTVIVVPFVSLFEVMIAMAVEREGYIGRDRRIHVEVLAEEKVAFLQYILQNPFLPLPRGGRIWGNMGHLLCNMFI